ncbi:MAG TPA: cell division protein FtsH, partial [Phycisphaerae bacterium]|nr:cell division protein FtsH [Phycisphaerae bacterium]
QADLEEARDKVRWGRARKSRVIDEKEKEITAWHEAGHALVQHHSEDADPLHKVSIIPRGEMGGATFSLPEKDRYLYTRRYCKATLQVILGGRVAEELFSGDISSGAASDIAHATALARRMVLDWGMSDKLGFVRYSADDHRPMFADLGGKEYSDRTAEVIDAEVRALIDEAYHATRTQLETHRQELQRLAAALLKYETLSADDVRRICEGETLDKPTVNELLEREHAKAAPADAPSAPTTKPLAEPG